MKIDLQAFVEGATHTLNGMIAGKMAGEQMARQQQEQEFNRQLNLAQLGGQQQQQQNQLLMSQLGNMTPESQAQALTSIAAQPNPNAGLLNTPYIQKHPEYARLLGVQPPAAAGAPAGWVGATTGQQIPQPAAAGAPGGTNFTVAGKQYALKGFDKAEAAKVMAALDQTYAKMRDVPITDPNQAAARDELFRQRGGIAQIKTPEDLARAQTLLNQAQLFHSQIGGPAAQSFSERQLQSDAAGYEQEFEKGNTGLSDQAFASTLPGWLQREKDIRARYGKRGYGGKGLASEEATIKEIERLNVTDPEQAAKLSRELRGRLQSKVTPQQEQRAQTNVLQMIGKLNPRSVTPDVVRTLYQNAGVGYLVEGLPDDALNLGGSALEKTWEKDFAVLTNPKRWAGLPKEARMAVLDEISGAAAQTGRKIELPADVVLQMSPLERAKLARQDRQINLTGRRLNQADARLLFEKEKFKWAQTHPGGAAGAKGSMLTQNAKAQTYRKVWEKSWADYDKLSTALKTTSADFDPMHPDPKDTDQVELSKKYKTALQAGTQYKNWLKTQGVDIDINVGGEGEVAPPSASAKPGVPPGAPVKPAATTSAATQQPAAAAKPPAPADVPYNFTFGGKSYKGVTKRQFRNSLMQQGATAAEVNAILRMTFAEGGQSGGGAQPGR